MKAQIVVVALAAVVELQRRDAQPLLVDLGGVRRVRARHAAADVGVVADGGGEGDALAVDEDRLEDEDVRQVHAAVEGIVHDEDVARIDVVARSARMIDVERGRDRAQVPGQGQPLRHQPAVGVGEGGGEIHVVPQHAGIGGAADGQRHLVGDGEHGVLEQLEGDGIGDAAGEPAAGSLGAHLRRPCAGSRCSARSRWRPLHRRASRPRRTTCRSPPRPRPR